jgi:hypothetical protein
MRYGLKNVIVWILKRAVKSAIDIFVGAGFGAIVCLIYFSLTSKSENNSSIFDVLEGAIFLFANGAIFLMPAVVMYNILPKFKSMLYWLITLIVVFYCIYFVFKVIKQGYGEGSEELALVLTTMNGIITYFWLCLSKRINFWPWLQN